MKITLTLLLIAFTISIQSIYSQNTTATYHRARIYHHADQVPLLMEIGIEMDHGVIKKGVFIESDFSLQELEQVLAAGFKYDIIIPNVTEYYARQNDHPSEPNSFRNSSCFNLEEYATPEHFNLGSMGGFFTYEEILAQLDLMATLYPEIVKGKQPISNFQTYEGRPIYWLKLSDNPNVDEDEPEMLYDAVHHAREPASVSSLLYYMWYLLENYDTDDEIKAILDNSELFFVPVVNPDGYIYNQTTNPEGGGLWRKNRREHGDGNFGVDNNRNYSYEWNTTGVSSNTGSNVYPGSAPFSESENQAIKWFCENHNFKIAFNNHTYSNLLLYPFGYALNQPTPDHLLFQTISAEMVSKNGFINQLSADLYPASGDSDDWMYVATPDKPKILAFTPEIGSTGFWPAQNEIIAICKSTMYMNITAAHLISKYAKVKEVSAFNLPSLSGEISFQLQRFGLESGDFNVSLVPISDNIMSVGNDMVFNSMNVLQTVSASIAYSLNPSVISGDEVVFSLQVNNGDYTQEYNVTKIYGTSELVFNQNSNDLNQWSSTDWSLETSDYYTGPSAITDSPNAEYNDNETKIIMLNDAIDLTNVSSANLSFYTKWDIEEGYDYVQLEISTDNGITWIPQCGNYTSIGNANQADNQPLYDGVQQNWVQEHISLSDYIGQSIDLRFKLVTDGFVTADGFYFDDLKINVIPIEDAVLHLNITMMLQGAYDANTNLMKDLLRTQNHIPLVEPYTALDYTFVGGGGETTSMDVLSVSGESAIVDWVIVELRENEAPYTILHSRAALLQSDGSVVDIDGLNSLQYNGLSNQDMIATVRHRNHLAVMNTVSFQANGDFNIDFTDPNTATFGDQAQLTFDAKTMLYSGDANFDGQVSAIDLNNYWRLENGNTYSYGVNKSDLNLDGVINTTDLNGYWRPNNSKSEQ